MRTGSLPRACALATIVGSVDWASSVGARSSGEVSNAMVLVLANFVIFVPRSDGSAPRPAPTTSMVPWAFSGSALNLARLRCSLLHRPCTSVGRALAAGRAAGPSPPGEAGERVHRLL